MASSTDRLRAAHERLNAERAEHATALRQQLKQEEQREATSKQRIADGLQRQQDQAADLRALQQELKTTRRQLTELDGQVARDAALRLLRQQLIYLHQQLTKQKQFTDDALEQQQLTTSQQQQDQEQLQQQLIDALTRLAAPRRVTITRNAAGKIVGGEVG